ncbi:CNNM domain-containing protein [Salinimicrobium sp. TH3]|uniref:CNNM domain-containing protein n=1 Tax=Salinimicrobium sp. TH3 TaxID=2997342 RepID=UPI002276A803|nr:hemolysin family protein [Salinimicrobium sp. TH3]MCY2685931.1 hemolysin family protein [Salinimicrobium sp. TH3]
MELLILYAVLSIFFSFLCSILEAALLSFTPSYIKMKKQEGKKFAETLARFKRNIDRPLIAILTVNTIAHTVGAIMVGVQAEKAFGDGTNAVAIVSALMTLAILVLSEIIPKTIGATYWQSLGNFTAKALKALIFPLKYTGILWLMMLTTKAIGKSAHVSTMSREEFIAIADVAEDEGVFEQNESTILKNLLIFRSIEAKDVMTPFSVAKIENEETSIEDFFHENRNLKFSRIPIYKDSPNNISGFVLKDDLLEEMIDKKGPEPLSILRRDLPAITREMPIPNLFDRFIKTRTHIAMVVDEYGNTIGLVTMEDIIETLLGLEIMDESDSIEDMQKLARKKWEERARKMGILSLDGDNSNSSK